MKDDGNHLTEEEEDKIHEDVAKGKGSFIYRDKFGRTGWLNLMKPRLVLAKRLLKKDGIIFVSIDDNEQAYLKVLMDEIFGENSFLNQLVWVSNKAGRQISSAPFAKTYEYILAYSGDDGFSGKEIDRYFLQKFMPSIYEKDHYEIKKDKKGEYILQSDLRNSNIRKFNEDTRKNLFYPIYVDYESQKISSNKFLGSVEIWPPKDSRGVQGVWRWQKSKVDRESYDLEVIKNSNEKYNIFTKKRNLTYTPKDIILGSSLSTGAGTSGARSLGIEFDNPKPVDLIKFLIDVHTSKNALVLDFFAGSGTTGQAVLELNKEDGGNRTFILSTNNEGEIGIEKTYERIYRLIKGVGTKGERDFSWIKHNDVFSKGNLRVFEIMERSVLLKDKLSDLDKVAIKNLELLNDHNKIKRANIFPLLTILRSAEN